MHNESPHEHRGPWLGTPWGVDRINAISLPSDRPLLFSVAAKLPCTVAAFTHASWLSEGWTHCNPKVMITGMMYMSWPPRLDIHGTYYFGYSYV